MRKLILALLMLGMARAGWAYTEISANLTGNQAWTTGTYYVTGTLTCSGTITVSAGVVVKFGSGASMARTSRGQLWTINGSIANPVYITSYNDNSIGDNVGGSGTPAIGDYVSFDATSGDAASASYGAITGAIVRYGTSVIGQSWPYSNGGTFTFTDCIISNFTNGFITISTTALNHCYVSNIANGATSIQNSVSGTNVVFYNVATTSGQCLTKTSKDILAISCGYVVSVTDLYGGTVTINNLTAITCTGVRQYNNTGNNGTLAILNSVFQGCTAAINGAAGTTTSNYNNFYSNTADYAGTVAGKTGDKTASNPVFASGTMAAAGTGILDTNVDDYFLNQSTSPCMDAGSDTAVNIGLDAYTTAVDKTLDTGTVDMGYHYLPADVAVTAGATATPALLRGAVLRGAVIR